MSHAKAIGPLQVLPAREEDLDQIVAIEQASFSAPWSRRMFEQELLANQFGHLLFARSEDDADPSGRVLGYICFWCIFEELRILNLGVLDSHRRRGVGLHLATHALTFGLANGTTRALLEVRASNRLAQALYAHLGFHEYGSRAAYYTNPQEDAILMALDPIPEAGC